MANLDSAPETAAPVRRRDSDPDTVVRAAGQIIAAAVAAAFMIPVGELRASSRRSAHAAFARQSAMYLAHVAFGLSYADAGRAFGRDRTTAAHACRVIEERRNNAGLDARLGSLEHLLRRLRFAGRVGA